MRHLTLLCLLLCLLPLSDAFAARPTVQITKGTKAKQGKLSVLDFYVRAKDTDGIARIQYRAAVDGKKSGWVNFPYYDYPGYQNHLPFRVDCNIFTFEVRSIDKKGLKSRIVKKTFTNLR